MYFGVHTHTPEPVFIYKYPAWNLCIFYERERIIRRIKAKNMGNMLDIAMNS